MGSYLDEVWGDSDIFGGKRKPKGKKKGKMRVEKDWDNLKQNLGDIKKWSRNKDGQTRDAYLKSMATAQKASRATKKAIQGTAYSSGKAFYKKVQQKVKEAQIKKALKKKGIEVY